MASIERVDMPVTIDTEARGLLKEFNNLLDCVCPCTRGSYIRAMQKRIESVLNKANRDAEFTVKTHKEGNEK